MTVKSMTYGFSQNKKFYKFFYEKQMTLIEAAVRNFFWLKMIRNQYLRNYITSQCSKLSPYLSPIHNGYIIIMFSNLSGTGRFLREIRACCRVITSRKHKEVFLVSRLSHTEHVSEAERRDTPLNIPLCGRALCSVAHSQSITLR